MAQQLFGKTLHELETLTHELAMPKFAAKQIADWLYKKNVTDIDCMSNLSKSSRAILTKNHEIGRSKAINVQTSVDGTRKYLFGTDKGFIESAYIPDNERHTLCISSQVGCKMACGFCMTGRQGFGGNLSCGQILNQIASIDESSKLTNIVFMGMGEPMDNIDEVLKSIEILTSAWGFAWSPRRITVSTIGIVPNMIRLLNETEVHLAVSLHNPFGQERGQLMPAEKAYAAQDIVAELRKFDWTHQRRLSFEYTMFAGYNDTPRHIKGLTTLLNGLHCRVNLINFNSIPDSPLKGSSRKTMEWFRNELNSRGLTTTIRNSRGQDIDAACGMLSTKEKNK